MKITIAPAETALACSTPALGIFWRIGDILLVDRCPPGNAETYGECMTHPVGHYERWEEWRALGGMQRARAGIPACVGSTEYDQWPRGRIVLEIPTHRFVIYADRHLRHGAAPAAISAAFRLGGLAVDVRSDPHYRTLPVRCRTS